MSSSSSPPASSYVVQQFDTERVIEEVRIRPELWDKHHRQYKHKEAREAAWLAIGYELIDDFESMDATIRLDVVKRIQQRWRTARDTYQKVKGEPHSKQKSVKKKGKRKYAYYDNLTFLDSMSAPPEDESNSDKEDNNISSDEEIVMGQVTQHTQRTQHPPQVLPTITVLPLPPPPPLQHASPHHPPSHKKKKIIIKTMSSSNTSSPISIHNTDIPTMDNPLQLESEDLAFFQSLQPTLMRFTNYQKMLFRTRVLQVIMEINHPVTLIDPIKIEKN